MTTQYNYSPFGITEMLGEASDNPFKYTGREDDGTGLYYYRARYYSPVMGRFISEDPIGFTGGDVNWYAYVGNSPLNWNDPLGQAVFPPGYFDNPGTYFENPPSNDSWFNIPINEPSPVHPLVCEVGWHVTCHLVCEPLTGNPFVCVSSCAAVSILFCPEECE